MGTFAILNSPPKALASLPSFNFSLVTCNVNPQAVSEIATSMNALNRTFGKMLGTGVPGSKAIQVNVIQAVTADLPKKLEAIAADNGGIGGMLLNATAYEQILNTGVLRFNRILCSRSAMLKDKTIIQTGGKSLKVVDYDLLGSQISQSMLSHIGVMDNPLNFVPQIFPGNPIPTPWMPCVDTSKKEAFWGLTELAEAAYATAGGGIGGLVAGAVAFCKAGYNMYKNHMDDDDEYQDYFTNDMKNFIFSHLPSGGGGFKKPWEKDYGGGEMFSDLLKDLLFNHVFDLNDFIGFGLMNPVDLLNDKYRLNLENFLGGRQVNFRVEIGEAKK